VVSRRERESRPHRPARPVVLDADGLARLDAARAALDALAAVRLSDAMSAHPGTDAQTTPESRSAAATASAAAHSALTTTGE
jgi:hypothetical protein